MMSRPVFLVSLLVMLIITSQLEWKQQLVPELDATPSISQKREEAVKEKIILMQERNIQRLNELIQSLREQLQRCRSMNETRQRTVSFLTEHITDIEPHQIFED